MQNQYINNYHQLEEDEIDIGELVGVIKKNIFKILSITLLFIFLASIYLYFKQNIYSSNTVITLESKQKSLGIGAMLSQVGFANIASSGNIDIEKAKVIITSKKFLVNILNKLDLDRDYFILKNFRKVEVDKFENLKIDIEYKNRDLYGTLFKIRPIDNNDFLLEIKSDFFNLKAIYPFEKSINHKYFQLKVTRLNGVDPYDLNKTESNIIQNMVDKNFKIGNRVYIVKDLDRERQLEKLLDNLSVEDMKSNILKIEYQGTLPQKVQSIVSKITKAFIDYQLNIKIKEFDRNLNIINNQIRDITFDIDKQIKKIEKFQIKNSVAVNMDTEKLVSDIYQKREQLEILSLKIREIDNFINSLKNGILNSILLTSVGVDISSIQKLIDSFISIDSSIRELELQQTNIDKSVTSNPLIASLIKELKDKKSLLETLLTDFTEEHPQVVNQKREIERLIDRINKNISVNLAKLVEEKEVIISNILTNISMVKKNLISQRKLLENELKKEEKLLNSIPPNKIASNRLNRIFQFNEKIYTALLNRKIDIEIDKTSLIANTKILESAYVSEEPDKPKVKLILLVSAISGFIIGIFVIFFREFLNKKIRDTKDIEKVTDIPIYGVIPSSNSISLIKKQLLNIKINIDFNLENLSCKKILVTSIKDDESKSKVASNLSKVVAENNSKIVLIDLNIKNPIIHKIFKLKNKFGITDYLIDNNIKREYDLVTKVSSSLHLIPIGSKLKGVDFFMNEKFIKLIKNLEKEYEYIIFNSTTADNPNTRVLFKYSDISLFILKENFSTIDEVEEIEKIRKIDNLERVGVVLN